MHKVFYKTCTILSYNQTFKHTISGNIDYVEIAGISHSFTGTSGIQCSSIFILNDGVVERDESFLVLLNTSNSNVDLVQNSATVSIADDDIVTVDWSSASYIVTEDGTSVRVCAEIVQGDIARPMTVSYSTSSGTAQSKPMVTAWLHNPFYLHCITCTQAWLIMLQFPVLHSLFGQPPILLVVKFKFLKMAFLKEMRIS